MRSRLLSLIGFILPVLATSCGATLVEPDRGMMSTERAATSTKLDPATTATGRVFTVDGTPIRGALVDPSPLDGQDWAGYESLRTTDAAGRYQLPLPGGRWDVAVSADGYTPTTVRIIVPTTGRVETDVTLEPT